MSERAAQQTQTVTTRTQTGVTARLGSVLLSRTLGERARLTRTARTAELVWAGTAADFMISMMIMVVHRTALRALRGLISLRAIYGKDHVPHAKKVRGLTSQRCRIA